MREMGEGVEVKHAIAPQRVRILETAINITAKERNEAYGSPFVNHSNIAALMNAYLDTRRSSTLGDIHLDAEDAAMLMVCVKMARIAQRWGSSQIDSFVDAAAYIAIASECREARFNGVDAMSEPSDVARAR